MPRLRGPARILAKRRRRPLLAPAAEAGTAVPARDQLLRSWPGRIFLVSAVVRLLVAALERLWPLPLIVDVIGILATLGLVFALGYFAWRLFRMAKRRLLWRVRRRLIISYIFIGVVPAMLIIGFFLLSAGLVSMTVSAYLFKDGYDAMTESIGIISQAAATDIARAPASVPDVLKRTRQIAHERFPNLNMSMIFIPGSRAATGEALVGPWEHTEPPRKVPGWAAVDGGFTGTVTVPVEEGSDEVHLVIRGVRHVRGGPAGNVGTVVTDLVIDDHALDYLRDRTSVKGGSAWLVSGRRTDPAASAMMATRAAEGRFSLFRNSVTFLDCTAWTEGRLRLDRQAAIATSHSLRELWARLSAAQSFSFGGMNFGVLFLWIVGFLGILFLIIQGVALVMGLALARSITSAIHELFMGTERVRQGDFTHRIQVTTNDQLGELSQSFNQMTGSIEGLLQTAAEKKRLDEELRIARQIQMSLLPRGPLDVPGLGITALCVPAREVGGDYYDFFQLPDDRLGVLIADVAGKGTSAALYMAELKGLVLALSQTQASPREMLIEVNRIISDNLDSRSFITMTYAVIDRRAALMTYCRAGHTPLMFLPGPSSPGAGAAQVLLPNGMVVGLRIPEAAERFTELLEEATIPLSAGDVIVLYTDGITEAMNHANDLFGESRLSGIIEEHGHLPSPELRERILREIEAFVGGADQHDDMTMILLKVEQALALTADVA
jgi:sigma-B regulation protein RsbU (phosphoserine phosphatase)